MPPSNHCGSCRLSQAAQSSWRLCSSSGKKTIKMTMRQETLLIQAEAVISKRLHLHYPCSWRHCRLNNTMLGGTPHCEKGNQTGSRTIILFKHQLIDVSHSVQIRKEGGSLQIWTQLGLGKMFNNWRQPLKARMVCVHQHTKKLMDILNLLYVMTHWYCQCSIMLKYTYNQPQTLNHNILQTTILACPLYYFLVGLETMRVQHFQDDA